MAEVSSGRGFQATRFLPIDPCYCTWLGVDGQTGEGSNLGVVGGVWVGVLAGVLTGVFKDVLARKLANSGVWALSNKFLRFY